MKTESKNITLQSPSSDNIAKDSAKQTINQVVQNNSNNGDVSNEYISGDKVVNQKTIYLNQKGNLTERHISQADIKRIASKVPKDYTIKTLYSSVDDECNKYGTEIVNKCIEIGYKVEIGLYGMILNYDKNIKRFNLEVIDSLKEANIHIYPIVK